MDPQMAEAMVVVMVMAMLEEMEQDLVAETTLNLDLAKGLSINYVII